MITKNMNNIPDSILFDYVLWYDRKFATSAKHSIGLKAVRCCRKYLQGETQAEGWNNDEIARVNLMFAIDPRG